jgi:putative transposase
MTRLPRIIIPGIPHHVVHTGNYNQDIFFNDNDRLSYMNLISYYSRKSRFNILGYCLMNNHIHLIGIPQNPDSISDFIKIAHQRYSITLNQKLERGGINFKCRHYTCPMDIPHTFNCFRYVEQNPGRAGIIANPVDYRWSSARAHVGMVDEFGILDRHWWNAYMNFTSWRDQLSQNLGDDQIRRIRDCTKFGAPLGSDEFVQSVEKLVKRPVWIAPKGRPKLVEVTH